MRGTPGVFLAVFVTVPFVGRAASCAVGPPRFTGAPFTGALACTSAGAPLGAVQRTSDSSGTPPVADQRCASSEPAPSQYAQAPSWIVSPPFPWRDRRARCSGAWHSQWTMLRVDKLACLPATRSQDRAPSTAPAVRSTFNTPERHMSFPMVIQDAGFSGGATSLRGFGAAIRCGLRLKSVALPGHCLDEPRRAPVIAKLHPQLADVTVDDVALDLELAAPDARQELLAAQHVARVRREQVEQGLLDRCER